MGVKIQACWMTTTYYVFDTYISVTFTSTFLHNVKCIHVQKHIWQTSEINKLRMRGKLWSNNTDTFKHKKSSCKSHFWSTTTIVSRRPRYTRRSDRPRFTTWEACGVMKHSTWRSFSAISFLLAFVASASAFFCLFCSSLFWYGILKRIIGLTDLSSNQ